MNTIRVRQLNLVVTNPFDEVHVLGASDTEFDLRRELCMVFRCGALDNAAWTQLQLHLGVTANRRHVCFDRSLSSKVSCFFTAVKLYEARMDMKKSRKLGTMPSPCREKLCPSHVLTCFDVESTALGARLRLDSKILGRYIPSGQERDGTLRRELCSRMHS